MQNQTKEKLNIVNNISKKNVKILVYVHIYYHDMWEELENYIKNLKKITYVSFDMIVTVVKDDPKLFDAIKKFKADTRIIKVLNKGYDLGPFIEILNKIDINVYDYLIKLHTKRNISYYFELNHFVLTGNRWRKNFCRLCLLQKILKNVLINLRMIRL